MIVLGLTGSIGMGKSTAAAMLRGLGVPVHDADAAVHRLMAKGGAAVSAIEAAFPGVVRDGTVDRKALGARVFGEPEELRRLEKILHPMVQAVARRFVQRARAQRRQIVVLDIPLLYETGGEKRCDAVIVVTAPRFLQHARVLARANMTPERLAQIEKLQMPDAEKRRRADIVINTGLGRRPAYLALRQALRNLPKRRKPPSRRSAA